MSPPPSFNPPPPFLAHFCCKKSRYLNRTVTCSYRAFLSFPLVSKCGGVNLVNIAAYFDSSKAGGPWWL